MMPGTVHCYVLAESWGYRALCFDALSACSTVVPKSSLELHALGDQSCDERSCSHEIVVLIRGTNIRQADVVQDCLTGR